jgi:uncharacterized protein (DUF2235 family)
MRNKVNTWKLKYSNMHFQESFRTIAKFGSLINPMILVLVFSNNGVKHFLEPASHQDKLQSIFELNVDQLMSLIPHRWE